MAEPDFAIPADFKDLDLEQITFFYNISYFGDAPIGKLGDMHQTICPRQDLHESTEIGNLYDGSFIDRAHFRFLGEVFYHFNRSLAFFFGVGSDFNQTGIIDFDAGVGFALNAANYFAAGSDDLADFIRVDLNGGDRRCIW